MLYVILLYNKFGIKVSEDSKEIDIYYFIRGNEFIEIFSQCKFLSKLESLDLGLNNLTSVEEARRFLRIAFSNNKII